MRRVLSTVIAVALLLGLGALAVMALPSGSTPMTASSLAAAPLAAEPDAPAAVENYNMIGLPLNSETNFTGQSLTWDADGLANYVGNSVQQVLRWDKDLQSYDSWDPETGDGYIGGNYTSEAFPLEVGHAFWMLLDSSGPEIVSFVGDVPAANTIKFTWKGTSPSCSYNEITIPLEQSALTDSDVLADDVGVAAVSQVLKWDANLQSFDSWDPNTNDGYVGGDYTTQAFEVKIGYPYVLCLTADADGIDWPQ